MKIGTPVKFRRKNGNQVRGVVATKVAKKGNGDWIGVNTGDKKNPVIAYVRPSQLAAA